MEAGFLLQNTNQPVSEPVVPVGHAFASVGKPIEIYHR